MRRRITFAIVGTVIAALVVAGAGTFVLDRLSARATTRRELERQAQSLIAIFDETTLFRSLVNANGTVLSTPAARQQELRRIVNRIKGLSNLSEEDIGILVGPTLDSLDGTTPRNIVLNPADIAALKAAPNTLSPAIAAVSSTRRRSAMQRCSSTWSSWPGRPSPTHARRSAGSSSRRRARSRSGFVVALWFSRGLTQRLRAAQATTHSIASGDLSARVPEPTSNDKDEVSDLSRSINSMAVQLERARGLERQFLMSITHDLRTPLTSIQGYAEALADEAIEPKKAAETILAQSRRLNRLVTDLLDLARLDSRSFSLDIVPGDVVGVVAGHRACVRTQSSRAQHRAVRPEAGRATDVCSRRSTRCDSIKPSPT